MSSVFTHLEQAKILDVKNVLYELVTYRLQKIEFGFTVDDMFVSGGCIASLLQNDTPKDYDIYFKTKSMADKVEAFCKLHASHVQDVNEKYRDSTSNDSGKLFTENAITLKSGLQFITKHVGTPKEIRDTFDFVHCKPYYDFADGKLYISKEQYDACISKKLIVNNPGSVTDHRIEKFMKRGYRNK